MLVIFSPIVECLLSLLKTSGSKDVCLFLNENFFYWFESDLGKEQSWEKENKKTIEIGELNYKNNTIMQRMANGPVEMSSAIPRGDFRITILPAQFIEWFAVKDNCVMKDASTICSTWKEQI